MVPRITLKLTDCDYDLFRSIAIEGLNYRTILPGDVIQSRKSLMKSRKKKVTIDTLKA